MRNLCKSLAEIKLTAAFLSRYFAIILILDVVERVRHSIGSPPLVPID